MIARSVVIDADSTLSGIEGIDWLAARRSAAVLAEVAALTDAAMAGAVALDEVYGSRLATVAPTRAEVDALAEAYVAEVAAGARECIAALRQAGAHVVIVSGGLRQALLPLAEHLGVVARDVHAVDVRFAADGAYAGFDAQSPLTTQQGKAAVVNAIGLARPVLAVGDGATDLAIRALGAADLFAAFTGFVRRDSVVARADLETPSFLHLSRYVLGTP